MKKTLIAMAVIASSGVALAEVTLTGSVVSGYKQSSVAGTDSPTNKLLAGVADAFVGGSGGNAAGDSSGLGLDTTTLTFAATEDIGNGFKVAASMNLDTLNRGSVAGGDSSLKLTTPVGRLTLQTYRPVDYLSAGISGVGGSGLDDRVFSARVDRDAVGFDTKVGPVFVGISHLEAGTTKRDAVSKVGLGVGAAGQSAQRLNSYSVTYVGGPVVANLNYLTYDGQGDTDATYKDVVRTALSYDLGVVKVGAGYSVTTTSAGGKVNDALVSASLPAGNWTFGANYGVGNVTDTKIGLNAAAAALQKQLPTSFPATPAGAAAAKGYAQTVLGITDDSLNGSRSGYSLNAAYALSKRTSLKASYVNWVASPFAAARNSETTLFLAHSF